MLAFTLLGLNLVFSCWNRVLGGTLMPWRVEYDEKLGVICCICAGHLELDEFKAATFEVIALSKVHRAHLGIIDTIELTSAMSTLEIYGMPDFFATTEADRQSKWTLLLPPEGQIREDVKFYVTTCLNRGWYLRTFDARQEAIDWLLNDASANRA